MMGNCKFARSHRRSIPRVDRLEWRRLLDAGLGGAGLWDLGQLFLEGPAPGGFDPSDLAPVEEAGTDAFLCMPELRVIDAAPEDQALLDLGPTQLAVRFDQALDPLSLGNDLMLERQGEDGVWREFFDSLARPYCELDPQDPSRLRVSLDSPLEPGRYRLSLAQDSFLMGSDGALVNPGVSGAPLSEFEVRTAGVGLSDAMDLGPIAPALLSLSGELNLDTDPGALELYRFELTAWSPLWRVGVEVHAQREGSPLRSTLAVLDAQGQVMVRSSLGRLDAPDDPFLFAGLAPGVYYIGVSGAGNAPGLPGGYDPITGAPGQAFSGVPGGSYTLNLLAEPAGPPVSVTQLVLDSLVPGQWPLVGARLQFDGIVLPGREATTGRATSGLELRDERGSLIPLDLAFWGPGRVEVLFPSNLTPGAYAIRVRDDGGITDLIGRAPVAIGLHDGELATFRVPEAAERAPETPTLHRKPDGYQISAVIAPGQAQEFEVAVVGRQPARLTIQLEGGDGLVTLSHASETQPALHWRVAPEQPIMDLLLLEDGVYRWRVEGQDGGTVTASVTLQLAGLSHEWLQATGLGQGPALGLIVSPQAALHSTTPFASAPTARAAGAGAYLPVSWQRDAADLGSPAPIDPTIDLPGGAGTSAELPVPLGGGLLLSAYSAPLGQPSTGPQQTAVAHVTGLARESVVGGEQGSGAVGRAVGGPRRRLAWATLPGIIRADEQVLTVATEPSIEAAVPVDDQSLPWALDWLDPWHMQWPAFDRAWLTSLVNPPASESATEGQGAEGLVGPREPEMLAETQTSESEGEDTLVSTRALRSGMGDAVGLALAAVAIMQFKRRHTRKRAATDRRSAPRGPLGWLNQSWLERRGSLRDRSQVLA